MKSGVIEGKRNPGRVQSTHGIVGVICRVTFDNTLHGNDASNRGKGRGFSEGVTGEDGLVLNKALQLHILKGDLLRDDEQSERTE